ncbi:hypothetical protein HYQ45_002685 [Verticillium longisporum]|uniref:Uncharacterized protein n=1 Tax=Verticillium longisporum TaxID=100787 RepID=A0A8I2ZWP5_VERLO|nr:hypothetical protein HYQ45_002685 [Verticillium longisporum]
MHSSALLRLVVGSSALIVGAQAQQSSELPIPSSVAPSSVAPSSVAPSSVAPSSAAPSSEPASSEAASSSLAASATATVTDTVTTTVHPTPTSFHYEPTYHPGPKPTLTHHYTIDKCQKYNGKDCYPGQVYTKHYEPKPWYYEECATYVSYVHGVATTCTDTYTRTSWYDQEKTTIKQYEHKQTYYETHGAATVTLTKAVPTQTLVPIYPTPVVTVKPEPVPGKTVTGDVPVNPPVTIIPHPEPEHTVTANKPVQPPVTVVPVPVPSPETSQVIVSGQPSLRDAGFLPLLIALGALPVGLAVLM